MQTPSNTIINEIPFDHLTTHLRVLKEFYVFLMPSANAIKILEVIINTVLQCNIVPNILSVYFVVNSQIVSPFWSNYMSKNHFKCWTTNNSKTLLSTRLANVETKKKNTHTHTYFLNPALMVLDIEDGRVQILPCVHYRSCSTRTCVLCSM